MAELPVKPDGAHNSLQEEQLFMELWMKYGQNVTRAYCESRNPPIQVVTKEVGARARVFAKRPGIAKHMKLAKEKALTKIEKVLDRYAISEERIASEIAKLAFTSVTDVLEWDKEGKVTIKSSEELDENVAGAISEVIETDKGLRIKLFDKKSALELLAKYRGMLVDRKETKNSSVNISFVIDKGDDIKEAVKTIDAEVKEISNGERRN